MLKSNIVTYSRFRNLSDLANFRTQAHPDKLAYRFLDGSATSGMTLTYGELFNDALSFSNALLSLGLRRRPVLLAFDHGPSFLKAFWACMFSGNIAVPVALPKGAHRIAALDNIVKSCGATHALTHDYFLNAIHRLAPESPLHSTITWVDVDSLDKAQPHGFTKPDADIAVLQYTSGSTGASKGVTISHANILANEEAIRRTFGHSEETVVINCLPHYHDMGLFGNLLQPFYVGGVCITMSPSTFVRRPAYLLETITAYRGNTCGGPNFIYEFCTDKDDKSGNASYDLSSWKVAFVGAEKVVRNSLLRFYSTFAQYGFRSEAFRACYGLAEATLLVSITEAPVALSEETVNCAEVNSVSCGTPTEEEQCIIVDPVSRRVCHEGVEGEVWLDGPNVACGYWNNPKATSDSFGAYTVDGQGPFLRTGDLGIRHGAEITITGRISAIIIKDGENFHAEDIELIALNAFPRGKVTRCVAMQEGCDAGEELSLLVEVGRSHARDFDCTFSGPLVASVVHQALGITPASVRFMKPGGLPTTPNGKVRRQGRSVDEDEIGRRILGVWKRKQEPLNRLSFNHEAGSVDIRLWLHTRVASCARIDAEHLTGSENFLSLGIESRTLFEWADELAGICGHTIDPMVFWEYPTVDELYGFLTDRMLVNTPRSSV